MCVSVCGCQNVLDNRKYNQSAIKMTFNMRHASPARLVSSRLVCCFFFIIFIIASWGCLLGLHSPPPPSFSFPLTLHAVFISFHFVRGLELNLLENASNSKFYEFTTFRFLPQQTPLPPLHHHYPLLLLDIFFLHPLLGSLRGDNCLAVCVCVMCKCNRKPT